MTRDANRGDSRWSFRKYWCWFKAAKRARSEEYLALNDDPK